MKESWWAFFATQAIDHGISDIIAIPIPMDVLIIDYILVLFSSEIRHHSIFPAIRKSCFCTISSFYLFLHPLLWA